MNVRVSAAWISVGTLGLVVSTLGSCARETPGHCAFMEGNATCDAAYAGTFCIFQGPDFLERAGIEYRNVNEAQRMGCYESEPTTPDGEAMGAEDFSCVPEGLEIGDRRELRGDLKDLAQRDLALPAFLAKYGLPEAEQRRECESGSGTTTGTSDSGSTSGSESSTTTGDSSSTTGPECMAHADCPDPTAPQCDPISGGCVPCEGEEGEAACESHDPMTPLCVNGTCVACIPENPVVCDDQLLLCDAATNTCIQCTEHARCGSEACELAVGRCFPEGLVVHVDGDAGAMPIPDYTSISSAVDAVDDGTHGVIVVHELNAEAAYQEAVTINGGKAIALLAAPGEAPIIQGTAGNPGLGVEGAGTVLYMDGLRVSLSPAQGLVVDGAFAWVDRSRIVQNTGGGVLAQNVAELTVRNCFVGGSVNNVPAFAVDGATATMVYTTVIGGLGSMAEGLACTAGSTVTVTDSIVVLQSDDDPVACGATFEHSASEMTLPGTDNVGAGDFTDASTWFANVAIGDFHLATPPMAIANAAEWNTGDPTTDIDGELRSTVDGTADHAGADRPM